MADQKPRPRDTAPLPSRCLVILRSRLDASTARALGRELAVSDVTIARAVRGEGLTPSMRRLLELQLLATAETGCDAAARDREMRAHARELEEAANAIEAKESLSEIDDRAVEALRKAAYTLRRWQETLDG